MWLHIFALWAIAVAQPIFDLLGANPEFFVAHRAGPLEVIILTAALAVVFPLVIALVVQLGRLAGPRARTGVFYVAFAALICVLAMQVAVRTGATTWFLALPVSVAVTVAVLFAYRQLALVRAFFSVLSMAALVVPALFLIKPGVRSLVAAERRDSSNVVTEPSSDASNATPVVFIVFDELPLVSLLDPSHNIDPLLYPNFTELARDGVWFRNATTVDDFTRFAVPALVAGNYPRAAALPSAVDYPNTVFTLLNRTHRLEVSEAVTNLCPRRLCPPKVETTLSDRLIAMARDVRVVFLHLILTEDLTSGLPDPTGTWAGFDDGDRDSAPDEGDDRSLSGNVPDPKAVAVAVRERWRQGIQASRVSPVREFIDGISADDPQPTFYFLHTLISHQPHHMLPGGNENKTWITLPGRTGWNRGHPWAVAQKYQRHLLQVGFVDHLVGQLAKRLKDAGLYDRALIIITSDHGISYLPGAPQRNFVMETAGEIMRIPLVIKFPKHLGVPGQISGVNAESIDVLPTIADVLNIDLPRAVDGTSLLDPARQERGSKTIFSGAKRRQFDFRADGPSLEAALRRKLDLFGDGTHNLHRAPRLPEYDGLIGQPLATMRVVEGGGKAEIANSWEYENVDVSAPAVVFDIAGRFASARPKTFVAISVNGVLEAVTQTWESNPRGWQATPRFAAWRPGRNAIEVFVIDRDDKGVLLRRVDLGQVRPADLNLILASAADEWGVGQGGFYSIEGPAEGKFFRWTRDRAVLTNLFTHDPPREVQVDVLWVPGGTPKELTIEANDCVLYKGIVSNAWSSTMSLDRCNLSRDALELTFRTVAVGTAEDSRRRGVALSRVVLR